MGIFNSLFAKKNKAIPLSFSDLKVDLHSHLIPGIDDGSKSLAESMAMIHKFVELGYQKIVTTPHIMQDVYPNHKDNIYAGRDLVLAQIEKEKLNIQFEAAAEHFYDDHLMKLVKNKEVLTFSDNYCLIEFGFHHAPNYEDNLFFEMLAAGYKPILAHFERYNYFHGSIDKALEYREKGVLIQVNANSLSGNYGGEVKKQAAKLIDANAIDFIASDAHRMQHLHMMEQTSNSSLWGKLSNLDLKNTALL